MRFVEPLFCVAAAKRIKSSEADSTNTTITPYYTGG